MSGSGQSPLLHFSFCHMITDHPILHLSVLMCNSGCMCWVTTCVCGAALTSPPACYLRRHTSLLPAWIKRLDSVLSGCVPCPQLLSLSPSSLTASSRGRRSGPIPGPSAGSRYAQEAAEVGRWRPGEVQGLGQQNQADGGSEEQSSGPGRAQ